MSGPALGGGGRALVPPRAGGVGGAGGGGGGVEGGSSTQHSSSILNTVCLQCGGCTTLFVYNDGGLFLEEDEIGVANR